MQEYFAAEMRLLREFAEEFAKNYPEQTRHLQVNSALDKDPYIERLLEGTAYLTAQIRQRLDADLPEICETLLEQLWPQMLRPFPSATIIQFQPKVGQLQTNYLLPKGTEIQSQPVGENSNKVSCRFRTTTDLLIRPLKLVHCEYKEKNGAILINLLLQAHPGITLQQLDLQDIIFYLHTETETALFLYHNLTSEVNSVNLSFPEYPTNPPKKLGAQNVIVAETFSMENALFPVNNKSFQGFQLLQEYFCFRAKYFFLRLSGIDAALLPQACQQVMIEIQTNSKFSEEYKFTDNLLQLHCVPAVNLFVSTSVPVQLTQREVEYPVIIDNAAQQTIYSVDNIEGIDAAGSRHSYSLMSSFAHREIVGNYYHLHFRPVSGALPVPFITVMEQKPVTMQTLSCHLTVTQGQLPHAQLQLNMLKIPAANFPSNIEFKNITRPSPMYLPPARANFRWTLLAHLTFNYMTLTDINNLKKLLQQYDWTMRQENRRKIDGIKQLSVQQRNMVKQGILHSGLEFIVTFDEENYLSIADIYHFATLLHQFFSLYVPINNFIITKAQTLPSYKEFSWQTFPEQKLPI